MEYVPGRTLGEVLKQEGRLQPERAAEVVAQVASALSFAHAAGIVHRDVKPANIMLTPQGEVKVMDFGIARAVATDTRSAIYSLGVVLYEALTGQVPFAADSPVAVAYKHVREPPTSPTRITPEIGADLEAVVLKAMAKNPANRYSTAQEMREDLERYLGGRPVLATPVLAPEADEGVTDDEAGVTAAGPGPTEVMADGPDPVRGRRRWIVGVAAGMVLGLAVL